MKVLSSGSLSFSSSVVVSSLAQAVSGRYDLLQGYHFKVVYIDVAEELYVTAAVSPEDGFEEWSFELLRKFPVTPDRATVEGAQRHVVTVLQYGARNGKPCTWTFFEVCFSVLMSEHVSCVFTMW